MDVWPFVYKRGRGSLRGGVGVPLGDSGDHLLARDVFPNGAVRAAGGISRLILRGVERHAARDNGGGQWEG